MPAPDEFWNELFAIDDNPSSNLAIQMWLVKKGGHPFLLLPRRSYPAAVTLDLYAAQTSLARAARVALRWSLATGWPFGARPVSLRTSPDDPFFKFLASQSKSPNAKIPVFGVLAGNPTRKGQRLLIAVFDADGEPAAVVKAGLSQQAKSYIELESSHLASMPRNTAGLPKVRAIFQSSRLSALALDFVSGHSPRPRQARALARLLGAWVQEDKTTVLTETPDWVRLQSACRAEPRFLAIADSLSKRVVSTTLMHGDLAPWNIRVSKAGDWTVFDWERCELQGIPGWDWFHYVIQAGMLVERRPAWSLVATIEGLIESAEFKAYAQRARISGIERELVLAYLLHTVFLIMPSEGLNAARDLLEAITPRFLQHINTRAGTGNSSAQPVGNARLR